MYLLRSLLPILGVFLFTGNTAASTANALSDSLQHILSHTSDPKQRIDLLLNIKDLNEDTDLNVPLSIQLFREASDIRDTYAMSIALIPILNRYATYIEKNDSLHFYIRTLRHLAPGTPQEGMDIYAEMHIAVCQLQGELNPQQQKVIAQQILEWCQASASAKTDIYIHTRQHILQGYAATYLNSQESASRLFKPQISQWETALSLIRRMPDPSIRLYFASELFPFLAQAYMEVRNYSAQVRLSNEYIRLLDEFFDSAQQAGRRPYLYTDNAYVPVYRQLIRCAYAEGKINRAEAYYQQFRTRMLAASGENLIRNKSHLYEMGCRWREAIGDYRRSLQYSDSLIGLIKNGNGYFRIMPETIIQAYHIRSRLQNRLGRVRDAYESYDRIYTLMDSLDRSERNNRIQAIRLRNDMDRMLLSEIHASIRSNIIALISAACIVLLLIAAGIYFYRGLRRNHRLQGGIVRLTRKAQESERMKSHFLNSVCNGIRAPFHAVDQAAWRLMMSEMSTDDRCKHLDILRRNTSQLLSTIDNMLEAANLGSLTEGLRFEQIDIHAVCLDELNHTEQQHPDSRVEYHFISSADSCHIRTHGRYFALVVRAMLDNAAKFTTEGSITLRCDVNAIKDIVCISVSDTGPGIAPAMRTTIFSAGPQNPAAGHGQSLALCALIAAHMQGSIRVDENYSSGARFIFTIPLSS